MPLWRRSELTVNFFCLVPSRRQVLLQLIIVANHQPEVFHRELPVLPELYSDYIVNKKVSFPLVKNLLQKNQIDFFKFRKVDIQLLHNVKKRNLLHS